jgi:RNA polymerase sigma factor for flagellar operon FliA
VGSRKPPRVGADWLAVLLGRRVLAQIHAGTAAGSTWLESGDAAPKLLRHRRGQSVLLQEIECEAEPTPSQMLLDEPPESPRNLAERALYERYLPLVRRVARRLMRQLPGHIAVDELIAVGWIGLVEGLRKRDTISTEEQFESYAIQRVRGAILDYLRTLDPLSRSMRRTSRQIARTVETMTSRLGRPPTEDEMAAGLGVSADAYRVTLSEIARSDPARIDLTDSSYPPSALEQAPDLVASRRQLADRISRVIDRLAQRLQLILRLYYIQDRSFREVGELLGVTEARVCQLHAEAIRLVRVELGVADQARSAGENRNVE